MKCRATVRISTKTCSLRPTATSREWYRPNPPLPSIKWGPRNNTNIQESALLIALHQVAVNKELYLENYWLKNKRAIDEEARTRADVYAWVIPAEQRRKVDAADMVNDLRRQGAGNSHGRRSAFKAGDVDVAAGDYIDPRRSALSHAGRHVLQRPELSAGQSAALRRHRLDHAVHAQREADADHTTRRCSTSR